MMRPSFLLYFLCLTLFQLTPSIGFTQDHADVSIYSLHLGVNLAPENSKLEPLQYADDDAVRFYQFVAPIARTSVLATVMDDSTQARHSADAHKAIAPVTRELELTLKRISKQMETDRDHGQTVIFLFSYSGHGISDEQSTKLVLLDGNIDRNWLKNKIMSLPANYIHLFIDACHAEGIVGSRGVIKNEADGDTRSLSTAEQKEMVSSDILHRYPNVGAIVASTLGKQTHEWSKLGSGVFTHELLSALSGASDVNSDGHINYYEVAAFMSAANRSVVDNRAKPDIVSYPPKLNEDTPIISMDWFDKATFLVSEKTPQQHFFLETANGTRILDVHPEPGSNLKLLIGANGKIWIRRAKESTEASFTTLADGGSLSMNELTFNEIQLGARGSIDESFEKGLFAHPFGPTYFSGWSDREKALAASGTENPIPPQNSANALSHIHKTTLPPTDTAFNKYTRRKHASIGFFVGSGVSLVATGIFTGMAVKAKSDFDATNIEVEAAQAKDRLMMYQGFAIGTGVLSLSSAIVGWILWPKQKLTVAPLVHGTETMGITMVGYF